MSSITQISPTRSQKIGFVLDRRVFIRLLSPEFDECEATRQAKKISRSNQKKGG